MWTGPLHKFWSQHIAASRSESAQECDERAGRRKRRREEEAIATVIGQGSDEDWDYGKWDNETLTEFNGNLVTDIFDEE